MAHPPQGGPYRGMSAEEKANAPKLTKALALRILSYLGPYKFKFILVIVAVSAGILDLILENAMFYLGGLIRA